MDPRLLAAGISAWITAQILFALLAVLIASSAMFWVLVRRWTSQRAWVALAEWGRDSGFRFRRDPVALPDPLGALRDRHPVVRTTLSKGKITIIRLEADLSAIATLPIMDDPPAPSVPSGPLPSRVFWNVLIRQIESSWKPTGLRPAAARVSLLDLFSLSSFPLMGPQERFVLFGTDSAAARALSGSAARALMPPDIGMLVSDRFLILDFSGRPFDSIEFSRMLAVAEQVAARLPTTPENAG